MVEIMNTLLRVLPLILIVALSGVSAHARKDDLLTVKERVIAELMKTPIDDGQIETIMHKINED